MAQANNGFEKEKCEAADISLSSSSRFLRWLDNFWYHHKWKVVIISFIAIVVIVGVVQMATKTRYDTTVTVAVNAPFYAENVRGLESALVEILPEDLNGDSEKNVQLSYYKIYSEAEMKAANEAETDAAGNPVIYVDEAYNKSQLSSFNSYLITGECTVMILSDYMYKDLVGRRTEDILLKPLSEIYGESLPEGSMPDGYGVRLGDTKAYKFFEELKFLPEDSVICIMRPFAMGGSSNEETYKNSLDYFRAIVDFGK